MVSLFNSIPRDADHTAELWTTVDKDKTNVRARAVYKLLPGFSLYLALMAKNFTFESMAESRCVDSFSMHMSLGASDICFRAGTGTC